MERKIALFGDGGHARSLSAIARPSLKTDCDRFEPDTVKEFIWCVAIGDNRARVAEAMRLARHGAKFATVVAPTAVVLSNLGEGTCVLHKAVIEPGCSIGHHCIINTSAVVCHDTTVGDFVHISPGATICGGCIIGNRVWVGAGSVVREKVIIGEGAVIGAGSVVVKNIPPGVTAYGVPCVPVVEQHEHTHSSLGVRPPCS